MDELALIDISGSPPDLALIRDIAGEVFAPLACGGGIRTLEHASLLVANGADKVLVNTGAALSPTLIPEIANKYGAQAVTVAIDVRGNAVHLDGGQTKTLLDPIEWACEAESRGAGEILLTSIERDGTMSGMDLGLISSVSSSVSIPVVACGGAGTPEHFREAIEAGAHAVAAGAIFSFTDETPRSVAKYLAKCGIPVRVAA